MDERKEYYSPDEVAELLGLHVRTVRRFIHEGKLAAVRVGKQYRIAESDLNALIGANGEKKSTTPSTQRRRQVVVSTTVDITVIGQKEQDRLVTLLLAVFQSLDRDQGGRRFQAIYYEEEARLRLLINADLDVTDDLLGAIRGVLNDGAQLQIGQDSE